MNHIKAILHQSFAARSPHPVFAVDGTSLEVWIGQAIKEESTSLGLVPAQGWLIDEEDLRWAWERIESIEPNTTSIVPVLVCGDDVDLSCTVLVVEQEASDDYIIWHRFGYSKSVGKEVGLTTQWLKGAPLLQFERNEFSDALAQFKELARSSWQ